VKKGGTKVGGSSITSELGSNPDRVAEGPVHVGEGYGAKEKKSSR